MDLYGDDELAELSDYEEEVDTKTSTTTTLKTTTIKTTLETTTTPKKLFAIVPPEKATTNFKKGENGRSNDKDDVTFQNTKITKCQIFKTQIFMLIKIQKSKFE